MLFKFCWVTMEMNEIGEYRWENSLPTCAHQFLMPTLLYLLEEIRPAEQRLFDLGCGNGALAHQLYSVGWDVSGVDPSKTGIAQARANFPEVSLSEGSAYDNLAGQYGTFPIVVSLEVIEHIFHPRQFAATAFSLLDAGGTVIISTPYHGYLKNLALAISGQMDQHFTALWDYGHIKFWSIKTLSRLLTEAGFKDIRSFRVGRIPALAKSMILVARKPAVLD
jgi:SAM-dependent methyltransferase